MSTVSQLGCLLRNKKWSSRPITYRTTLVDARWAGPFHSRGRGENRLVPSGVVTQGMAAQFAQAILTAG